eukprot:m.49673 g.49673  ORF g.49673 m.49673 type:complete len:77 (+) comp7464_c2_seq1:1003-1233(+)
MCINPPTEDATKSYPGSFIRGPLEPHPGKKDYSIESLPLLFFLFFLSIHALTHYRCHSQIDTCDFTIYKLGICIFQ